MFPERLSNAIHKICYEQHLSYRSASELCGISFRHFGSIARGQTNLSLDMLEKLCVGFGTTPNVLLGIDAIAGLSELTFRMPMPVLSRHRLPLAYGKYTLFAVCPRCNCDIEREYQPFCSNCGQMLDWSKFDKSIIVI